MVTVPDHKRVLLVLLVKGIYNFILGDQNFRMQLDNSIEHEMLSLINN